MKVEKMVDESEAAKREIIHNREAEWWSKNCLKWLSAHPEARESWMQTHDSFRGMPCPPGAAPDQSPENGFITIKAASGRGIFVIAADSFAKMPKRAQKQLMSYANK